MVTNPEHEPDPPTTEERAERALRVAVAGHPQGAIRRIILWCILFAAIGLGVWFEPLLAVALGSGVLLLATDNLL